MHSAQVARFHVDDLWFLAFNGSDHEGGIFLEDFIAMKVKECGGCISAGHLSEHHHSTLLQSAQVSTRLKEVTNGMGIDKFAQVVDLVVNDNPQVLFSVVLGHIGASEGLGRHCSRSKG